MNKTKKAFTLIEVLITVAIIGILAGVAVPSYRGYIKKSKMQKLQIPMETIAGYLDTLIADGESIEGKTIKNIPKKMRKGLDENSGSGDGFTITLATPSKDKYKLTGKLDGYDGSISLDQDGKKTKVGTDLSWIK